LSDLLERYRWFIVGVLALPLAVGVGFLLKDRLDGPDPLHLDLPPDELRVYVTGAVQRPGVYPLSNGERWIDALDAAGGPTEDADLAAVDMARRVRDEETILVPRQGQTAVSGISRRILTSFRASERSAPATSSARVRRSGPSPAWTSCWSGSSCRPLSWTRSRVW